MDDPAAPPAPPRFPALAAGFTAIYLIWGSTYLGNKYAVETLPPFLMAGSRFTLAGLALYLVLRGRGAARPPGAQWRAALLAGGPLLLGGHGPGAAGARAQVPSGPPGLLGGAAAAWVAPVGRLPLAGAGPGPRRVPGIALGFVGCAVLVGAPVAGGLEGVEWGT